MVSSKDRSALLLEKKPVLLDVVLKSDIQRQVGPCQGKVTNCPLECSRINAYRIRCTGGVTTSLPISTD